MVGALATVLLFHLTSWAQEPGPDIKVESTPINRAAKLGASTCGSGEEERGCQNEEEGAKTATPRGEGKCNRIFHVGWTTP